MLVLAAWAGVASAEGWADAWSGSRWHLQMEETTPVPVELSAVQNLSFRTRAVQWDAVLACGEPTILGKKTVEVDCAFEAVALHATPRGTDGPIPTDQQVLEDLVTRLKTTPVRIGLSEDGRVVSVDLPGLQARNRRESESRETLRLLVSDLVAPFHLKRPEALGESWTEKGSELLRAPSQSLSMGMSKVQHQLTVQDGHRLVQSTGEGTFSAPFEPWQFSAASKLPQQAGARSTTSLGGNAGMGATRPVSASASNEGMGPAVSPSATTPTDVLFSGNLVSVAVLGEGDQLTERVWAMVAGPTASSVGSFDGTNVWYAGHVVRLAEGEAVDVGSTSVVAPPGAKVEGLEPWVPLETL